MLPINLTNSSNDEKTAQGSALWGMLKSHLLRGFIIVPTFDEVTFEAWIALHVKAKYYLCTDSAVHSTERSLIGWKKSDLVVFSSEQNRTFLKLCVLLSQSIRETMTQEGTGVFPCMQRSQILRPFISVSFFQEVHFLTYMGTRAENKTQNLANNGSFQKIILSTLLSMYNNF